MSNTWNRADTARFDDEWYMSLPLELRLTYMEMISYSSSGRGTIQTGNLAFVARRIGVTERHVRDLIKVAGDRVRVGEHEMVMTRYSKWNPKSDAERKADQRERERKSQENNDTSHKDVTTASQTSHDNVTTESQDVTPTIRYDTIRYDTIRNETLSPQPPKGESSQSDAHAAFAIMTDWNILAHELNLPKIEKLDKARQTAVTMRIKDGLDWTLIQAKCRGSTQFIRSYLTFDWIFKNKGNWLKLQEGNYDERHGDGIGGNGTTPEPSEARKQLDDWGTTINTDELNARRLPKA